jgi:ABC-2 type transport system permease protein
MLPAWLPTELSPLTYFSWGVRAATYDPASAPLSAPTALGVLAALTVVFFAAGAFALPTTD